MLPCHWLFFLNGFLMVACQTDTWIYNLANLCWLFKCFLIISNAATNTLLHKSFYHQSSEEILGVVCCINRYEHFKDFYKLSNLTTSFKDLIRNTSLCTYTCILEGFQEVSCSFLKTTSCVKVSRIPFLHFLMKMNMSAFCVWQIREQRQKLFCNMLSPSN